MRKAVLAAVLLVTMLCWAAPNPNFIYTITVHVSSAQLRWRGASAVVQRLHVVINGKMYELEADENRSRLLALGDYKARLIKNEYRTTYESSQAYEFLFPDQTTREV